MFFCCLIVGFRDKKIIFNLDDQWRVTVLVNDACIRLDLCQRFVPLLYDSETYWQQILKLLIFEKDVKSVSVVILPKKKMFLLSGHFNAMN